MNKSELSSILNTVLSLKPLTAIRLLLMILFVFLFANVASAQTNTWDGSSNNNWNTAANWSLNLVPTAAHDVIIPNSNAGNANPLINTSAVCKTFTMSSGNRANNVTISGANSLTVSGIVSIGAGTGNGDNKLINVGNGTLSCASITITAAGNSNRTSGVTLSTGTINVIGNITMGDANDDITFSGAGALNIGGTITGGTLITSTGTVNYNNAGNQNIGNYTYYNLTLSGSGIKTFGAATTITNNFSIATSAIANLGIYTHTAGSLTLGGVAQVPESWGSTSSLADNKNDTYFSISTGLVNNSCTSPTITSQPLALTICENSGGSFTVATSASTPSYQWQYSTDAGVNWINTDGVTGFSGYSLNTLTLTNIPSSYNGYRVRCIVRSSSGCRTNSNSALLTVTSPTISGTVTPATCSNGSDGAITITGLSVPIEFKKADNDHIDLGSSLLNNKSKFTIEGWIKFNIADVGARMSLFGQNNVIEFFLNNTTIQLYTAGGGSITTPLTAAFGNNTWHHIAATGDGTNLRIYIDGALVATGGSTTSNYGTSTETSKIGSGVVDGITYTTGGGGGFTGQMQKVGFYSTALLPATITSLATSPTTYLGTETGLIAGYNFFEGSGTTLTTLPAGTNGTFGNSPQWVYTYAWTKTETPAYTESTKDISGLSPGDYSLSISGGQCPIAKTFTVGATNSTPATPAVTLTLPTCAVATGTITVNTPTPAAGLDYTVTGTSPVIAAVTNSSGIFPFLAAGTYDVTVTNTCGTSTATSVTLALVNKTWDGTSWSPLGDPTPDQNIEFTGNYSLSTDITACSCTVTSGTVTIPTDKYLKLGGNLTVNTPGTLTFENNASLVQTNDAAVNSGNITYKRASTTNREFDYTYWSSPVVGQNLLAVSPSTKLDKFFSFDAATENWFQEDPSSTEMTIGKGYIIRGVPSSMPPPPGFPVASFIGEPNNGPQSIAVSSGTKSNLIGNPYPSAIDADTFILANTSAIDGTLYFWTHNTPIAIGTPDPGTGVWAYSGNDYATYTLAGGVGTSGNFSDINGNGIMDTGEEVVSNRPTGKIAAGQSFFATSTAAGGTVNFTNAMRIDGSGTPLNNSNFYKTKNPIAKTTTTIEKHRVWLNLTNTEGAFKQTLVSYITGASNTWDNLYDGESFDGNDFLDFYTINEEKNLTIQGRALPFDENDEIPLGYRIAVDGTFTISIDETDGTLANQPIFIEDKLTNTVFDLKRGNYTFNTTAGTFDDRFVLRYTNKTLGTNDLVAQSNHVLISIKHKEIKINSFSETIDKVTIYDVLGRQIYQNGNVNSNEFLITNLVSSHQTLIVKTSLQNGKTVTDKIIY